MFGGWMAVQCLLLTTQIGRCRSQEKRSTSHLTEWANAGHRGLSGCATDFQPTRSHTISSPVPRPLTVWTVEWVILQRNVCFSAAVDGVIVSSQADKTVAERTIMDRFIVSLVLA